VSVLEGRVQVASLSGDRAQLLNAGKEAQVLEDGRILRLARPDVQKTLAWRQRRLSFEEAPLEEMVREFNRYNSAVRLRVEGVEPETHRYGGIFDADDPESLIQLLKGESDLVVERQGGEILIRPHNSAAHTAR
jgi:transmembrane sensor